MPSSDSWGVLSRHSARCICRRCRDARRRAEFDEWRAHRPEVERVYSDEASAHIHQLVRLGWKQKQIAHVAGLAQSTVSTAKERGVLINAETADAILAVQPWRHGGDPSGGGRRVAAAVIEGDAWPEASALTPVARPRRRPR